MTLYEELGEANLRLMVDRFYDLVLKDTRIAHLFKTDLVLVKSKQFMFLSQFLGGPDLYTAEYGHPRMRMRHMPHEITPASAYAWLENMKSSIESLEISQDLKDRLFQRFPHVAAHMVNKPVT